ncbi:MAG: hypothetical protein AAGK00_06800 [Pseudomonadota bacterium]
MTAKTAGKLAAEGFWTSLRTLRDHWVLLVFLATGLFWLRDTYEDFVDLPARVSELHQVVGDLRRDIASLDQAVAGGAPDLSPALAFPGAKHRVADGWPGQAVAVRLDPVVPVRPACRPGDLVAYMIDATGMWFVVDTDLDRMPELDGQQELAFGVRVHPRMAVGRAQFLIEVAQHCGTHLQVDRSPRLHFRVLARTGAAPH